MTILALRMPAQIVQVMWHAATAGHQAADLRLVNLVRHHQAWTCPMQHTMLTCMNLACDTDIKQGPYLNRTLVLRYFFMNECPLLFQRGENHASLESQRKALWEASAGQMSTIVLRRLGLTTNHVKTAQC